MGMSANFCRNPQNKFIFVRENFMDKSSSSLFFIERFSVSVAARLFTAF